MVFLTNGKVFAEEPLCLMTKGVAHLKYNSKDLSTIAIKIATQMKQLAG